MLLSKSQKAEAFIADSPLRQRSIRPKPNSRISVWRRDVKKWLPG